MDRLCKNSFTTERALGDFLELSRISKRFAGVHALRNVDLELDVGEVHCIVGENGSGKSTLIKIISGVEEPERGGSIVVAGKAYPKLNPVRSTQCGIQVIYQDLSLFPNLNVAENIAMAHHLGGLHRVDWRALKSAANAAMAKVGIELDPDRKVSDLSIAGRQLVAICRALAAEAKLLIMDEPTASLTRHEVDSLISLVSELKRAGICIVFVSHRLDEVLEIADRVTVLRDGAKVGTFPADTIDGRKLSHLMTGQAFDYQVQAHDVSASPVVLEVDSLWRDGDYQDISFQLRAGEVVGLTGLLGAGRTELALSLFGMNPSDRGTIAINGCPVTLNRNIDAIDLGIAYVSEDRLALGLVLEQPISANITLTVLERLVGRLGLIRTRARRAHVARWISDLAIKVSNPANPVKTLSGGNQQRVVLAKWMATNPRVLILDSPTVGVDISAKHGIYEIIRRLAREGVAVLMISDEIPEVLYHSDRVLVMREGRLTVDVPADKTSEDALRRAVNA
ncbi:sugar ABC transporter ATP-binding protein [Bradyrhizobium sp. 137]|uniref:sugar ABC transporter ATP-binding protein n=1 Tax=Bradyrhizobium sp. 137 TaxID=2782614 RepID=UPI001FF73B71|nr:sugar ABC transporter ATP-binding protein [Bradyrhizobium sp. 137]